MAELALGIGGRAVRRGAGECAPVHALTTSAASEVAAGLVADDGAVLIGGVSRFAEVNGVRLHYVEAGDPAGPLVVLLHGFPNFWLLWRRQIPVLAAAGLRVVAPDLRGYNLSSKPAGVRAYAVAELARDVAALVAERRAERAVVVGHDWGGVVAWRLAYSHPHVVRR
ncbi:MAG TPA: alpha/beta hydrolase, partial [Gemmatimonadaceae bacterium]|nr:alpha/beta hydrolase [Gemmatimonadaceae bacterium]